MARKWRNRRLKKHENEACFCDGSCQSTPQEIGCRELSFWAIRMCHTFLKRIFNLLSKMVWHISVAQNLTKCQPISWDAPLTPQTEWVAARVCLEKSSGIWSIFELQRCVTPFWKGDWISFSKMHETSLLLNNWVRGSWFSDEHIWKGRVAKPFVEHSMLLGGEHKQSRTKPHQQKIPSHLESRIAWLICSWRLSLWLKKIGCNHFSSFDFALNNWSPVNQFSSYEKILTFS